MKINLSYVLIVALCAGLSQSQLTLDGGEGTGKSNGSVACNDSNCRVPLCKCADAKIPNDIPFDDTPMMIGLSFNGVLTSGHSKYIKRILNPVFKNPNGCPVHGTFFISDKGNGTTDYCFVQGLFNNNNEIAPGASVYECPYTDCDSQGHLFRRWRHEEAEKKIFGQKRQIEVKARINHSFLRGFRLPFLDQRGNAHFKTLKKFAFAYDSSVIVRSEDVRRNQMLRFWPHTLDFPANYTCPTCPTLKSLCQDHSNCSLAMNSVWIVPMHFLNIEGKNPCPTLIKDEVAENRLDTKNCVPIKDLSKQILVDQLMDNFERHYKTNKAPFVINIELSWFDRVGDMLTDALVEFINKLTNEKQKSLIHWGGVQEDIYFVSLSKIVEWVEYPTPLNVIANRWLWDCDGSTFDYDEECESLKRLRENSKELEEMRKNRTSLYDLKNEDLFRSGVLTGVIVIFVVSMLFVIIYDRINK